jgi:hypothetical protein
MKKLLFAFAISTVLVSACNSNKGGHEQHESHAASMEAESTDEELPDYSEVDDSFKAQINDLTDNYFIIKDALVQTNAEETRAAAESWLASAEAISAGVLNDSEAVFFNDHLSALKKSVQSMATSEDVEKQREEFFNVSNGTYSLIKAFKAKATDVYFQFCPMAFNNTGAGWLSNQKEIRNPYFGDKMLKCGKVKETL